MSWLIFACVNCACNIKRTEIPIIKHYITCVFYDIIVRSHWLIGVLRWEYVCHSCDLLDSRAVLRNIIFYRSNRGFSVFT